MYNIIIYNIIIYKSLWTPPQKKPSQNHILFFKKVYMTVYFYMHCVIESIIEVCKWYKKFTQSLLHNILHKFEFGYIS